MPGHRFHQPDHRDSRRFLIIAHANLGTIIVNKCLMKPPFGRGATTGSRLWPGATDVGSQPNIRSWVLSDRHSFIRRRTRREQPTSNIAPGWRWARRNLLVNRVFRVLLRRQIIWAHDRWW
jgi:hypothetical protein